MNLAQLRYVRAVAQTGSFTQAAQKCHVTQPTLSNGIAQLEDEFGEKLFLRTTRTVSLTPFGKHMLPFIENTLDAQASLLREAKDFVNTAAAVVRIGLSPLVQSGWLREMLDDFRSTRAGLEIILREQNMADLYRMLDEGKLDFVFGLADRYRPSWANTFLYREPLCYIPGGKALPENGGDIAFDAIAGETLVMVPNGCGLARATRAIFRSHRKKLSEYPGEALSYQVLEEWAALGLGAAILPQSRLQSGKNRALFLKDRKGEPITLEFDAIWLNSPDMPAHLQDFVQYLQEQKND